MNHDNENSIKLRQKQVVMSMEDSRVESQCAPIRIPV